MSTQSILNSFLNLVNYSNVYQLPCHNNAQILAFHAGNVRNGQRLTGKDLIKQNIEREAHRLHLYSQHIIDLAIEEIWNLRITPSQKNQFINLANNANIINQSRVSRTHLINNTSTIDQIVRIATNNPFENDFFNGVKNFDSNSLEFSILPAGCFGSYSFP